MNAAVDFNDENNFMIYGNLTQPTKPKEEGPILDSFTELITDLIFFVVVCILIGAFGTVTNVINIIVYYRQGVLSCGSNLNLFSLSVADLGVSFTTFVHGAGFAVIVADIEDLRWDPFGIVYLVVGWPVMVFIMANRLLTAYVAFERCLCVVLPFHVKGLFTTRRSLFYILSVYAYLFLTHIPIYVVHRFGFEMQEATNISKLVLLYTEEREVVHSIVFNLNNFIVSISAVVILFVCTVVTSTKIKTSKEWRKSVSRVTGDQAEITHTSDSVDKEISLRNIDNPKNKTMTDDTIDKETRLVKMIVIVSIIFLICYIPDVFLIIAKAVDERIRVNGPHFRLAKLLYSFTFVGSVLNSSVNIFIYYRMSSRYRKEFCYLFSMSLEKKKLNG